MDKIKELEEVIELQKKELQRRQELISSLSVANLKLGDAIRKHREQTGHNMCWENDEELWSVLNDGVNINHTRPPREEFLLKCKEYCDSRQAERSGNVNWKFVEQMFGKEEDWKK